MPLRETTNGEFGCLLVPVRHRRRRPGQAAPLIRLANQRSQEREYLRSSRQIEEKKLPGSTDAQSRLVRNSSSIAFRKSKPIQRNASRDNLQPRITFVSKRMMNLTLASQVGDIHACIL